MGCIRLENIYKRATCFRSRQAKSDFGMLQCRPLCRQLLIEQAQIVLAEVEEEEDSLCVSFVLLFPDLGLFLDGDGIVNSVLILPILRSV